MYEYVYETHHYVQGIQIKKIYIFLKFQEYLYSFYYMSDTTGRGNASRSNTYCLKAEVVVVIAFLKAGLWMVLSLPELETFHLHVMQYVGEAEVPWATVPRLIPHWTDAADGLESEWFACYLSMSLSVHIWKIKEYSEVWMARLNQTMLSWCPSRAF